jgi:hypothetical protein
VGFFKRLDARVELIDWSKSEMRDLFHSTMAANRDPETGRRTNQEIADLARLSVFARAFKDTRMTGYLQGCAITNDEMQSQVWQVSAEDARLEIQARMNP